jgi:hypothetical protein
MTWAQRLEQPTKWFLADPLKEHQVKQLQSGQECILKLLSRLNSGLVDSSKCTYLVHPTATNAAQRKVKGAMNANTNPKLTSFERQRNLCLVRLQEGRGRLARSKKSMGWLVKGQIKATPEQLLGLEKRVREPTNVQAFNPLVREVNIALGYIVVAT